MLSTLKWYRTLHSRIDSRCEGAIDRDLMRIESGRSAASYSAPNSERSHPRQQSGWLDTKPFGSAIIAIHLSARYSQRPANVFSFEASHFLVRQDLFRQSSVRLRSLLWGLRSGIFR